MTKNKKTGERPPLSWDELKRRQERRTQIHADQTRARAAAKVAKRRAVRAASYEIIAENWGKPRT
jgi:hypothetical protein